MLWRIRFKSALVLDVLLLVVMMGRYGSAQPNPYRTIENWAKLPPGRTWGDVIGVDVDRKGNVWVVDRCTPTSCNGPNKQPILEFSSSGHLVKSFGDGMFVWAHMIYIDKDGNLWLTDARGKDGKGYQVFKFSPQGKLLLTLGKAGIAGDGPDTFTGPSGVAVGRDGDIFVADGHLQENGDALNCRVLKFSREGKFIKSWGKKGSAPGEFDAPHAIAIDSKGRLFVGDENNNRIEIFDQEGKFLDQWKQFGRPSGVNIDVNDNIYVADANSDSKTNPGFKRGLRIGNVKDGVVRAFIPALPETNPDNLIEVATADRAGNLYAAERRTHNFKKYVVASTY